jgi:microcystin-dependent protein
MTFRTIHTVYGLQRMAAAEATGTPINITHVAVGDGNGNPVEPSEAQTALVREVFRATVNRVFQDPANLKRFTAELIIPATAGGFVLREVGVYDVDGALFVVGNLPETYKPNIAEGSYADTVIRVEFMVTNASVVTLQIDPAVAVASQAWVLNNITSCALLPGGTTGQVLRKASNGCGDTEWADAGDVNVIVSTIEEHQVLAALQTSVILSTVTTSGLAVYINGERLDRKTGATGWQPDPADPDTRIILGAAYAAGTRITLVQNEALGDVPFPLARDLNLSDLPNKATARANLDVFSRAEARQLAPAGQVAHFARSTAPNGWLKANGAAVSRTAYADLFAAIGTTFGAGDGFNTFTLPDLRGEFLRGWDDARGVDAGRVFGSFQSDAFKSHTHETDVANTNVAGSAGVLVAGSFAPETIDTTATGSTETRPRNRALLACIKF